MRRVMLLSCCLVFLSSCVGGGPFDNSRMGRQAAETIKSGQQNPDHFRAGQDFYDKVAEEFRTLEGEDRQVPIELNEEVKAAVEYFANEAPRFMSRSLSRSHRYLPMMTRILREKGLPEDLVYMALIESGFRNDAVSPAAAVGPWQFIAATGKRYGLRIDDWVDERMDPEKSTRAAADYLFDLHGMFNSWYLASAAYNCGEGKILKGLKQFETDDFWQIAAEDGFLRAETKGYVPKFLAAIIISRDPERYGITGVVPEEPLRYDTVEVPYTTDLDVIARLVGVSEDEMRELNPALKLWCTPLDAQNYTVHVPEGKGGIFRTEYAKLTPDERMRVSTHVVNSGETLKDIAGGFNLSEATLKKFNKLRNTRLKAGQKLRLPVDVKTYLARKQQYETKLSAKLANLEKSGQKVVYTVKAGDTPWRIAGKFDVQWKELAAWNNIKDEKSLKPGQKLVVYLGNSGNGHVVPTSSGKKKKAETKAAPATSGEKPETKTASAASDAKPVKYTVRDGDTLWTIAMRFKCQPEEIRRANGMKGNVLQKGQVLKIASDDAVSAPDAKQPAEDKQPMELKTAAVKERDTRKAKQASPASDSAKSAKAAEPASYKVQKDDTLWKIAARFKVKAEDIRAANNLKTNSIHPGQVLKIGAGSATATVAQADFAQEEPEPKKEPSARKATAEVQPAASENPPGTYTVQKDDTLWKIARKFNLSMDELREANGLKNDALRPGQTIKLSKPTKSAAAKTSGGSDNNAGPKSVSYTVQNGDTLWKIARRFKVKPGEIKSWNSMTSDDLRPGTVLQIIAREG